MSFGTTGGRRTPALRGLSLTIHPRQTVALVGESGCGKSVTALSILRLVPCPPGRFEGGSVCFEGRDLLTLTRRQMLALRGGRIAMIFQEPMTSLNPVLAVGEQIAEAVRLHRGAGRAEALEIAAGALVAVGMPRPRDVMREFPHRLSGGMRQRVMIAMALVCRPSLLLADEPTTALDVTIQAQVLELLARLRREQGTAMMLISHDLGVVARHADVVCVMYGGRPVEYAGVFELFDRPLHPYTRGLLRAIPRLEERRRRLSTIEEFLGDPAEHRRADGSGRAVVPWWPAADPPPDLARDGGGDFVLHKVEPGHWIGCWRTGSLAQAPPEPPDLADLRET